MSDIEPLRAVPTLIVGLGGTGSLGVQYAKRKIRRKLGRYTLNQEIPGKIPFIEFLVLDTTAIDDPVESLRGDEYINMGNVNVPRIISAIDKNPLFERALRWFPRHINPGQIDSGARGVRHIGRLCFFDKKQYIDQRLRSKIETITEHASVEKALKEQFVNLSVEPGSTIDVHLITSLCGGTGSACLLDVAYLIQHIVEEQLKQGANGIAHLVTTEPFANDKSIGPISREYIRYNFAITLAEIERFMSFDVAVGDGDRRVKDQRWEAEYLDGSVVSSVVKPFSLTYLLGCKVGENISKESICELAGEAITLTTVHPENNLLKDRVGNMKAYVINQKDEASEKIRAYSSYNVRILTAEFDDHIRKASTYFAAAAIIKSMCGENGRTGSAEEKLNELAAKDEEKGFIMGFSWEELVAGLFGEMESEMDISPTIFANVVRDMKKPERNWLGQTTELSLDRKIAIAKDRYDKFKDARKELSFKYKAQIDAWSPKVIARLAEKVNSFMKKGVSLVEIEEIANLLSERLKKTGASLKSYRDAILSFEAGNDKWYKESINTDKFSDEASKHLRAELIGPIINSVDTHLTRLSKNVSDLFEQCKKATTFLNSVRGRMEEERGMPPSFTERLIWTRESVDSEVQQKSTMLVRAFIDRLELDAPPEKGVDKNLAFLWYLDPDRPERSDTVKGRLREVARTVIQTEFRERQVIDFNSDRDEVTQLVELAAPAWQIQRAGMDIAEVSITNCPRETAMGKRIDDLGKGISFNQNSHATSQVFVFRSEHGVTADRLLSLEDCIKSLRRKLSSEGKTDINDLCLDPSWQIEDPSTLEKLAYKCALFSLGNLFGFIEETTSKYFFTDEAQNQIKLTTSADPTSNAQRSAAFRTFLRMKAERDKGLIELCTRIVGEWEMRRNEQPVQFRDEVQSYIQTLKERIINEHKFGRAEDIENEVAQYRKEHEALNDLVIQNLNKYIAGINSKDNGQAEK